MANLSALRTAGRLAEVLWRRPNRWRSIGLLVTVIGLNLGLVAVALLLTYWQLAFYDALEARDWAAFVSLLLSVHRTASGSLVVGFLPLLSAFVLLTVYSLYLKQALQIRWRRWLTEALVERWLARRSYHLMKLGIGSVDNPDQRIAEDVALYVEGALTLGIGLLRAIVSLISFVVVLWALSSAVAIAGLAVPGGLVWCALLYAAAGTAVTHFLARSLSQLNGQRQRHEADFRSGLIRVREHAEGIAAHSGEPCERAGLLGLFEAVAVNWQCIMAVTKRMTLFTALHGQVALVLPLVIVAPAYFAGSLSLGGMFQTASAFVQVQAALSWIVENYGPVAEWTAAAGRLRDLAGALEEASRHGGGATVTGGSREALVATALTVDLPDGRHLVEADRLELAAGRNVVISGPSGAGKSTLLRALAGLWPFGSGIVRVPEGRLMLLPQRPYLPPGTLRHVLAYPAPEASYPDRAIRRLLQELGLERLANLLDLQADWSSRLSGGEAQRIALARALLHRPDWLMLDEATANLDPASEALFYRALETHLPAATLISVAHRRSSGASTERTLHVARGTVSDRENEA
jgi:putative ATP-binding cassette transporter